MRRRNSGWVFMKLSLGTARVASEFSYWTASQAWSWLIHICVSFQALDNRPRVVAVRGFTADCENDLIVHMEHFGELVDMDFAAAGRGKPVTAYFTYKTRRDAEQVCTLLSESGLWVVRRLESFSRLHAMTLTECDLLAILAFPYLLTLLFG